jgi:hypothetical protein
MSRPATQPPESLTFAEVCRRALASADKAERERRLAAEEEARRYYDYDTGPERDHIHAFAHTHNVLACACGDVKVTDRRS